jgi:hypothetical protein
MTQLPDVRTGAAAPFPPAPQAFCQSKGGALAYWDTPQQYADLARLVLDLAKSSGKVYHAYIGAAQAPGSPEPSGGWAWLHGAQAPLPAAGGFPWAKGEPNQHNAAQHKEDCAVVATYHGDKAAGALVDDFPCNYATPQGKFMFGGHDPKLTVACRVPA